ncbi:hypothetical protein ACJX0J_031476, partial [Zea mays]
MNWIYVIIHNGWINLFCLFCLLYISWVYNLMLILGNVLHITTLLLEDGRDRENNLDKFIHIPNIGGCIQKYILTFFPKPYLICGHVCIKEYNYKLIEKVDRPIDIAIEIYNNYIYSMRDPENLGTFIAVSTTNRLDRLQHNV